MGVTVSFGLARVLLSILLLSPSAVRGANDAVPTFTKLPSSVVEFSNSTGTTLECKTDQIDTKIQWHLKDGNLVTNVKDLRRIDDDGNLVFPPFSAETFRQDVHATVYKCTATNTLGIIVSHDIQVKAVVLQPYEVYVYDVYAMQGNTAVMRCNVPSFMTSYVNVTAWIRDSVMVIKSMQVDQNSKYSLMPTGELFVKDVDMKDTTTSFQCQTYNRLSGETVKRSTSGKLFVTEPQGNVPPKVMLSKNIITAKQGETVFLPCEVQANPPATLRWKNIVTGKSDSDLNGRQIQVSGSLVIKNVLPSDNGTYRCTASNSAGREIVTTDLIVTEPIFISMAHESMIADVGKPISILCKVTGFFLQPIIWLKNGKLISFNNQVVLNNGNSSIHIYSVSIDDKGMYQCCVKNEFEGACASTALTLGDIPPIITEKFHTAIKYPGESLKLKCAAQGNPRPTINWFLDENELTTTDKITIDVHNDKNDNIVSKLTINKLRTEDGGLYKCVAENQAEKDFHWSRINVHGHIGVRSQPPVNAVSGSTVILNCPAYGYPISSISWEKDGTELPTEIRQIQSDNDSLIINNVVKSIDNGIYMCTVTNSQETEIRARVQLDVLVAPKLSSFSFQDELVQEGSRGRLQCVVVEGDIPLVIQWLKDGKPVPLNLGVTIRDIDEFSSILTIASITPRHNGKYTCLAKNAAGVTSFSTALAVNVSPKITPFYFPESGLIEGVLARVSCVVYQGDLPIKINWLRNGKIISSNENIITKSIDDYSSILTIENVQRHHAGNYTCTAQNSAASISHTTNLLVNVPPKIVPFVFQDDHLIEGSLLRVSCVVSRGDLPLTISWLKDGKQLPESVTVKEVDSYSAVLSIDPVMQKHSGSYTCKAQNQAGFTSYNADLVVQVPPKWILEPTSQTVRNGIDVYFHCKAEGYPQPKITWAFTKDIKTKTRPIFNIPGEIEIQKNGTLTLRAISKNLEGRYICLASNGVGHSPSKTATLSILAPPQFTYEEQTLNGKHGENISLGCSPKGDMPITITWYFQKKLVVSDTRFLVTEVKTNSTSTLTILKLSRNDSTEFTCKAENSYGSDSINFFLNVQEPPEAPVLNMNSQAGNRSVFLTWSKPFDGKSQITNYLIQYKKRNDNWQLKKFNETIDGSKTALNVMNLLPAVSYTFRIAAVNEIGMSKFSNEVTQKTDADAPTGMVQNIEVEPIDGNTLRITWKAPRKDTWNGPIRGYNIGYRTDGSGDAYEFSALEVPEDYTEDLIYQISKLRKYTMYTIVIQAYNDKGVGPLSEPILVMTSEDVPSIAPDGLRCSALSSKSIYVLWNPLPPESINGILRGYKVLYKPITEWYDSQIQFKTSEKEKVTLPNLEVNTNYSITILAYTKVGDGVKTLPVFCKTHEDVPDRPNEIKALQSSSDSVVVAWKPPKRTFGESIKYNVYYRPLSESEEIGGEALLKTEQSKINNAHTYQADSEYFEVKGLRKNQKYAFWVSATSPIGEGQHSDVMTQTVAESTVAATSASFDDVINTPWKRDVTLPCRAVGIPAPQRKWTVGNQLVTVGGSKVLLSDGTLLINKVDSKDSGNYTCSIFNPHGRDQVQYSLHVQVPPSAPIMDVISKSRSSIQLKWKPGTNGGDPIQGYVLHYRKDGAKGEWETVELSADKEIHTLDNLGCGANYQVFMEAFNKIGKGLPCDTIKTSTEGSEITIPTKDQLLHEGSTFVSVHLESWPMTTCPVGKFQVEYKTLTADEWTTVSSSIRPTQRKLVIPGLMPATWYALRVTAHTNGDVIPAEYKFATRTTTGVTIPPPEIKMEKPQAPVYIFYLDPVIFIPAVALLIVVIIASVIICIWIKRKHGSVGTPSDYDASTWNGKASSYATSTLYATIPHQHTQRRRGHGHGHSHGHGLDPYASGRVMDHFLDSDAWVESRTLTRAVPHNATLHGVRVLPQRMSESMQQAFNIATPGFQETTFAFANALPNEMNQPDNGYDKPPKGM